MLKLLLLTIISVYTTVYFAQDTLTSQEKRDFRQDMARDQINELKEGVLLIQLKTKQNTIDAYLSKGLTEKANKVKRLQALDNKSIIKGFRQYFNFCPVYFYYSSDLTNLKDKNFSAITFLDDSLAPTPLDINLDTVNYYISGISKSNFNNTTLNNIPNYERPYERGIKFDAFIIKNKDLQQLATPFPYYSKTHVAVKVNDKKRWESIKKLNARLHSYYR